jgi:hypothetical protein
VKVIYAISQLPKWKTLDQPERQQLTGREGLDAEKLSNGNRFCWYQDQHDRMAVLLLAVIISVFYATVPFLYNFANSGQIIITELFTIYFLCIVEVLLCTIFFWRRSDFLASFETRMSTWKPDLKNFIIMTVRVSDPPALPAPSSSHQDNPSQPHT